MAVQNLGDLGIKWQDVKGLQSQKQMLQDSFIDPLKDSKNGDVPTLKITTLLLYGVPGAGKSYLIKGMAHEIGQKRVLHVFASDIISSWLDGTSRALENLKVRLTEAVKPCIVVFDEMETLKYPECTAWKNYAAVKSQLLKFLTERTKNCAATICINSRPFNMDPDLLKCFASTLLIPLPGTDVRRDILQLSMSNTSHDLTEEDFVTLAVQTDGFSGADISCLVRDFLMEPIRVVQQATHYRKVYNQSTSSTSSGDTKDAMLTPCSPEDSDAIEMDWTQIEPDTLLPHPVNMNHVRKILDRTKPSVSREEVQLLENFQ